MTSPTSRNQPAGPLTSSAQPDQAGQPASRPILFSGPMVKAILGGRKTVTRRVCKPTATMSNESRSRGPCPYGKPGDRLWVRETWCAGDPATPNVLGIIPRNEVKVGMRVVYRATSNYSGDEPPWHPSIFMPRWASRITLYIVSVRVERLQEISEEDAKEEGIEPGPDGMFKGAHGGLFSTAKHAYAQLWHSINGKKHPWASNPWCWVIEFRRIDA